MKIVKDYYIDEFGKQRKFYKCIEENIVWCEIYPTFLNKRIIGIYCFQDVYINSKYVEDLNSFSWETEQPRWVVKYVDTKKHKYEYKYFRYFENAKRFANEITKKKYFIEISAAQGLYMIPIKKG